MHFKAQIKLRIFRENDKENKGKWQIFLQKSTFLVDKNKLKKFWNIKPKIQNILIKKTNFKTFHFKMYLEILWTKMIIFLHFKGKL